MGFPSRGNVDLEMPQPPLPFSPNTLQQRRDRGGPVQSQVLTSKSQLVQISYAKVQVIQVIQVTKLVPPRV